MYRNSTLSIPVNSNLYWCSPRDFSYVDYTVYIIYIYIIYILYCIVLHIYILYYIAYILYCIILHIIYILCACVQGVGVGVMEGGCGCIMHADG